MATNRTISQCKDDLKAAADSLGTYASTYLIEPTQITTDSLPLFSVLDGVDADEFEIVDTLETIYDARYEFGTVIVMNTAEDEANVIAARDAYITELLTLQQAAGTRPFRVASPGPRIFKSHWGQVEGWFVTMTFSRFVVEDFTP